MAGSNKEVSLVIKAKDDAKKAIDSVAEALRNLTEIQAGTGREARNTGSLLGRLQGAFKDLDAEIKGLAALNKVASNLDKAAAAVGALDAKVRESVTEQERLTAAQTAAAEKVNQLRAASEAAAKAYDTQKKAVAGLSAEQKKDTAATEAARKSRDDLRTAASNAADALRTAKRQETDLTSKVERATTAATAQATALAQANTELNEIAAMAQRASAALGGVEATQQAVAAASLRASQAQERLKASMGALAGGTPTAAIALPTSRAGQTAAYRGQIDAVNQAKVAWADAQAEANRLAAAIRAVDAPTKEMEADFLAAQAASRSAKQEYLNQGAALNQLHAQLEQARQAQQTLKDAEAKAAAQSRATTAATNSQAAAQRSAAASGLNLRNAFTGIYGESRQAMNMFQRFRGEVLSLASAYVGLYAAIAGIGAVINTAIAYQSAQNKLGVVFSQDAVQVRTEMTYLEAEADRLGVKFTTLADNYADFAVAAQGANFNLADTRRIFKAVTESGVVLNVSADDMQGIFKALTQIMSKGSVQAEELRGQLGDRMTGAFKLMADAIGVTTGQLDKMLKQGQVVADRSTMVSFADTLTDKYGKELPAALKSLNSEIGRFQNNLVEGEKRIGEAGFTKGLTTSLNDLNSFFKSDKGVKFFESIGIVLGKFVGMLPELVQNFDKFMLLFRTFATFKVAQVFMNLIAGFKGVQLDAAGAGMAISRFKAQLLQTSAAGGTFAGAAGMMRNALISLDGAALTATAVVRGLWAAIGGWPGLIITAATFAIAALAGNWLTGVDNATAALDQHEKLVGNIQQAYNDAGGAVDNWAEKIKGVTATELAANTIKLSQAVRDARKDLSDFAGTAQDAYSTAGIDKLVEQFYQGQITASDFREQLDKIAQSNPNLDKTWIAQLLAVANKAADGETALRQNEAAMRLLSGTASSTDRTLLGLAGSMDAVNASADTSAIDDYTKSLKNLQNFVPNLKAGNNLADQISAINKAAFDAYQKAPTAEDKAAVLTTRGQALKAVNDEYTKSTAPPKARGSGGGRGKTEAEKQKDFNDELDRTIAARGFEITQLQRTEKEQQVQAALEDARVKAAKDHLAFTDGQAASIRKSVEAEYDAKVAAENQKKVDAARLELAQVQGKELTRNQFIMEKLSVTSLNGLTAEQKAWADLEGQIYDVTAAEKTRKAAQEAVDSSVSNLQAQQQAIQQMIETYSALGDDGQVNALQVQLEGVNGELVKALDSAIAFYKALDPATNPNAAATIAGLEATRASVGALGQKVTVTAQQINEQFASIAVDGISKFAEEVGQGTNVFQAFGDAVRQTASDAILYIAKLVEQALILKLLMQTPIGKFLAGGINTIGAEAMSKASDKLNEAGVVVAGAAAAIYGAALALKAAGSSAGAGGTASIASSIATAFIHHTGGTVGRSAVPTRSVYSGLFNNAMRYHTGGVVGLKPSEVPIIAQKGEVIDPGDGSVFSKIFGGGGGQGGGLNLKIVQVSKPADILKEALADTAGQKVLINHVGENSRAFSAAISR